MTRQMAKHRLLIWLLVVVLVITSVISNGSVFASTDNHMRLAGQDRFGTSAAISEKLIADDQDSNLQDILLNASGGGFAENLAFGYSDPYDGWYHDEKAAYDAGEREQQKIGHYLSIISQDYHVTGFAMSQNRVAEQSFGIYEGLGITTKVFRSLLDEHTAAEKAKLDNAKETLATLSGEEVAAAKDNVKAKQAAYDQAVKTAETAEAAVKAAKAEAEKAAAALQEAAAAYEDAVKDYNEKEAAYEEAAKAVEEYAKENN